METQSPAVDKLFAAVSAMQSTLKGAKTNSNNPFFNSSYADLEAVWDAIRAPLALNNLCVIQTLENTETGVMIKTILGHSSGQWISSSLLLKPVKADPQSYGSAISYGRRYSLTAITGVYETDDDANLATHQRSEPAPAPQQVPPASPQPQRINPPQPAQPPRQAFTPPAGVRTLSDAQLKRLWAMGKNFAWTDEQIHTVAMAKWQVESLKLLSRLQYDELCNLVQSCGFADWQDEQKF